MNFIFDNSVTMVLIFICNIILTEVYIKCRYEFKDITC